MTFDIKNKKIIITGGCGFIGSEFIRTIIKKNKNITILNIDNLTYASNNSLEYLKKNKFYKFKKININNYKKLSIAFFEFKPDLLINFAAESHVDNSIKSSKKFINTNIFGVYNLLEISRKYIEKKNKKKFLFLQISTDEVYGDIINKKSSKETDNVIPSSPYSASKAAAENLVVAWSRTYKMPYIITNSSNNYGPFQNKEKLIPTVINNILNNKKIPIYGNGKQQRNWIHVSDNINAILTILQKGKLNNKYNIGSANLLTNLNLIKLIFKYIKVNNLIKSKIKFKDVINYVEDRKGHDIKYDLNISKLKNLNWKPNISIHDGLKDTINWHINKK